MPGKPGGLCAQTTLAKRNRYISIVNSFAHLFYREIALWSHKNRYRFIVCESCQLVKEIVTFYLIITMGYVTVSCRMVFNKFVK